MLKTNSSSIPIAQPLTRRERDILLHLVEHKSNQEIAALESLALSSVKWYVQQVCAKLGVRRRGEAVEQALALGLLKAELPLPDRPNAGLQPKHNLPVQMTSFIGREREISELQQLLSKKETRLLTLTGSGGTGKTRLALRIATEMVDTYPDGVWLVELAPLSDPRLVPQAVAAALGQVEHPDKTVLAFLIDYFREKRPLLILDNCEHLIEACAELAAGLLRAVPGLKILATSREILGMAGEVPYRVPPLSYPNPNAKPQWEYIAAFEAVRLFVERAKVVSPGFAITEDNASTLVQIATRLDGIPLALELASARLRLLSAEEIAARLDDAFALLTGGSRTALPRHQTLQALIDWSYNLLSDPERTLLRRLSVFAGSWTLESAEVVSREGKIVLSLLGQLADKSLILNVPSSGGETRFHMLETVRQYARTRLVEAGEDQQVRNRHLAYYLTLIEQLEPELRSKTQVEMLYQIDRELDNLRVALEWALQIDVEAELRLGSALMWFWHIRGLREEGIIWLQRGLDEQKHSRYEMVQVGSNAKVRAKALTALGFHITYRDPDSRKIAEPILAEAIMLYRAYETEDCPGLAWALTWWAMCMYYGGETVRAAEVSQTALRLFRERGVPAGIAENLNILGDCLQDPALKKRTYLEMLAIEKACGDTEGIAIAYLALGRAEFIDGLYENACTSFEASLLHFYRVGDQRFTGIVRWNLAIAAHFNGQPERSVQQIEGAIENFREIADDEWVSYCLIWQAQFELAQERYDQAAVANQEAGWIVEKTGKAQIRTHVLYQQARLARLQGNYTLAHVRALEGLDAGRETGFEKMLVLQELGFLALRDGDQSHARGLWREGFQTLIKRESFDWVNFSLDGLADLAAREGKIELAARLFGTRLWCGIANTLSPIERTEREVILADLRKALGSERFEQLREEGRAMSFLQVLALMKEDDKVLQAKSTPYDFS